MRTHDSRRRHGECNTPAERDAERAADEGKRDRFSEAIVYIEARSKVNLEKAFGGSRDVQEMILQVSGIIRGRAIGGGAGVAGAGMMD